MDGECQVDKINVESPALVKCRSMNGKWTLALTCVVPFILTGCDPAQPQTQQPPAKPHYQRFLPVQAEVVMTEGIPWYGFFALDTKTGTLCSTIKDRVFKGPSEWANDVPNCSLLLASNPD
jgi:hypothetical protein